MCILDIRAFVLFSLDNMHVVLTQKWVLAFRLFASRGRVSGQTPRGAARRTGPKVAADPLMSLSMSTAPTPSVSRGRDVNLGRDRLTGLTESGVVRVTRAKQL